MRSDGSRFTFGVWGLRRVRLTLLLCSQLSATVPVGTAAKAVTFGGLKLQGFASVLISVTSFKASTCRSYFFPKLHRTCGVGVKTLLRIFDC